MLDNLRRPLSLLRCRGCLDLDVEPKAESAVSTLSSAGAWAEPVFNYSHRVVSFVHEEVVGHVNDEPDFRLFRDEDALEWSVFTVVFVVLILFDNFILHKEQQVLSFGRACAHTLFWIFCASLFNIYIYASFGSDAAFTWATGYLLEWMLSLDNLFVFHLVFQIYKTPNELKHKPLFYGIIGAILFRMMFFIVGETLFHSAWWMHLVLGSFLIYTGIRAMLTDDDEEDSAVFRATAWLSKRIPLVNAYPEGRFFVRVENDTSHPTLPSSSHERPQADCEKPYTFDVHETTIGSCFAPSGSKYQWKATMLLLVVVCLEFTDIIFAVDSVSAIVAQIPDLYLAYTACVFAMLGLRATYFIIDELIRSFFLLKYGVASILVFIGAKLMASKHLDMSNGSVLLILVGTVATCVVGSVLYERILPQDPRV